MSVLIFFFLHKDAPILDGDGGFSPVIDNSPFFPLQGPGEGTFFYIQRGNFGNLGGDALCLGV